MPELNLKQIEERLEEEFSTKENYKDRKLIFWYDPQGDFEEDIDSFNIRDTKILKLTPTNQFRTKVLLEREDTNSNYLIYAPFEKPKPEDNHLEDTYLYSKNFVADRISLIMADLNIPQDFRTYLEDHADFFRAKDRTEKFYKLGIRDFKKDTIEKGIIQVILGSPLSFKEAVRALLTSPKEKQERLIKELQKYKILDTFWGYLRYELGYLSGEPNINDFLLSLFSSSLKSDFNQEITQWEDLSTSNPNDARIFLDSLRNNIHYQEDYERIAEEISQSLHIEQVLDSLPIESYYRVNSIPQIDQQVIKWILKQLKEEDLTLTVDKLSIPDLIEERLSTYYGEKLKETYLMLLAAEELIRKGLSFSPEFSSIEEAFDEYSSETYRLDQLYRKFYYYFDRLQETEDFEELRNQVENIYTNLYLEPEIRRWNELLEKEQSYYGVNLQRSLYSRELSPLKSKTAVIISDGLRYEIGQELFEEFIKNPSYSGEISPMGGILPSFTRLAMSVMLPHSKIELNEEEEILVDGKTAYDLKQRQEQLQKENEKNIALKFDEIKHFNKSQLRETTNGKNLIYIYHNQIDSRGDKPETEDEVFKASQEAIEEIKDLIRKLVNANVRSFIITADHGFLYKRNKLQEMDKISLENVSDYKVNRRYIISEKPIDQEGLISIPAKKAFFNDDSRYLNFPLTQNVFKARGAGINYVHGGSSPQESVIPFIKLKAARSKTEQREAGISLFSQINKITNLYTNIAFYQKEPIGNEVVPAKYKIYLYSPEDNKIISNTQTFIANSTEPEQNSRIKTFPFDLSQMEYDRNKTYYIIAKNEDGIEVLREPVVIDLPFTTSFDFGF